MAVRVFLAGGIIAVLIAVSSVLVRAQPRQPDPLYGLLQLQPAPACDRVCIGLLMARLRARGADLRCTGSCQEEVRRGLDFLRNYHPAPNRHIQDIKAKLRAQRRERLLDGFAPASQHYDDLNDCSVGCLEELNAQRQQAAIKALQFNRCLCDSAEARSAYRGYLEASYVVGHDGALRLMDGVYSSALQGDYEAISYPGRRIVERATPWLRDRVRDMYVFSASVLGSLWLTGKFYGMTLAEIRASLGPAMWPNPVDAAVIAGWTALLLDKLVFGGTILPEIYYLIWDRPQRD